MNEKQNSEELIMGFSYDHPECREGEIYLGNFTHEDAKKIGLKTKRAGCLSYCADGKPYPFQNEHGVLPYFCNVDEFNSPDGE